MAVVLVSETPIFGMRAAFAIVLGVSVACGEANPSGTRAETPDPSTVGEIDVWVTTGDRSRLLAREADLSFVPASPDAPFTLSVNQDRVYQSMVGFGAAVTDASAWLIQTKMTAPQRDSLLAALFDPHVGIGLSFTRITIGASDFSLDHYSYDDVPAGETDPELAQFSIERAREALLPVLKRALEINPDLAIMATPWSAPGWMKTTGSLIQGRDRKSVV